MKSARYQDYVIKDGKLVGAFEEMYRDHADPWEQLKEVTATDKIIAAALADHINARRIMEIGCGFGHLTHRFTASGMSALGVDISPTAIEKAKRFYPDTAFEVGELMDLDRYRRFAPDAIVMSQITWYVLDKLEAFLAFLKSELPGAALIHVLTVYPPGVQKYGADFFTDLRGICAYFEARGMKILERGQHQTADEGEHARTYFLGKWNR